MSWDNNVYDYPEKHGLTVVGQLDDPEASYSFSTVVFWANGKKVYAAGDSGCSCPSPFEGYDTIDSLTVIPTQKAAREFVEGFERDHYTDYDLADKNRVLEAVASALKKEGK